MSRTDPHTVMTARVGARTRERAAASVDPTRRRRAYLRLTLGARVRGRWDTWRLRGHVDPHTGHVPPPPDLLALAMALPVRADQLLALQDWWFVRVRTPRELAREMNRRRDVVEGLHRLLTGCPAADTAVIERLYLADDLTAEIARLGG